MAFFSVTFFLALFCQALAGKTCLERHRSEHGFALVEHVYHSFSTNSLSACYIACNMQPACQSFNYNLADKICEFNNDTKYFRREYFVEKATSVYADNPDSGKFNFCSTTWSSRMNFKQIKKLAFVFKHLWILYVYYLHPYDNYHMFFIIIFISFTKIFQILRCKIINIHSYPWWFFCHLMKVSISLYKLQHINWCTKMLVSKEIVFLRQKTNGTFTIVN